jgi:hypothetical protein
VVRLFGAQYGRPGLVRQCLGRAVMAVHGSVRCGRVGSGTARQGKFWRGRAVVFGHRLGRSSGSGWACSGVVRQPGSGTVG